MADPRRRIAFVEVFTSRQQNGSAAGRIPAKLPRVKTDRQDALSQFVAATLPGRAISLAPASADASFRSYWRVRDGAATWIVMDAPPEQEDVRPWLDIGNRLRAAGLHTPQVLAADLDRGFVLMEDLGTRTYLPELTDASVEHLYGDAFEALLRMQSEVPARDLPVFDATRTIPEMELLGPWFLDRHLGLQPSCTDWDVIEHAFRLIAASADEQPRRFMHRDYHSRNLLIATERNPALAATALANPGIIDFQGAMFGPVTYDLASLLRDCYIAWPIERIDAWVESYRRRLIDAGIVDVDGAQFRRWFDSIGLQRHIKVLGVFCRLWYRDGKSGYLADLPRVLAYVLEVARLYPALLDFAELLEQAVGDRDITQPRPLESATA
jgi:aminoglycoside/choline kinase family phosphotransferase